MGSVADDTREVKPQNDEVAAPEEVQALAPLGEQGLALALSREQALALVAEAWATVDVEAIRAEAAEQIDNARENTRRFEEGFREEPVLLSKPPVVPSLSLPPPKNRC